MKKVKKLYFLCLIALTFIVCAIIFGAFTHQNTVNADAAYSDTANYIAGYDTVFDIRADRTMTVTEDLTFHFYGKSGFVREIPVNGGERVRNIRVKELDGTTEKNVYYNVTDGEDEHNNPFIWVDIGSQEVKYENRTYRLTYDYIVPATGDEAKNNIIALAPVGSGYGFAVKNVNIKMLLPDGFLNDRQTLCYIDNSNKTPVDIIAGEENGRSVLCAHVDALAPYTGIRFDVHFGEGALKSYFDFTPYIFVLIGLALVVVLLIVKALCFSKSHLTPVVNFEAPNNMDPLLMGKLIDTRVNNEDITSMIFYFADKGYLKISLDENNSPTLIRIVRNLPSSCTDYERVMFEGLFARGETVTPAQLANRFYKTCERVTAMVNSRARGLFTSKSMSVAVLFAALGGLLLGAAPFALGLIQISVKYILVAPFLAIIPALIIFGASQTVRWYELKISKKKKALFSLLIALGCAALSLLYALLVPHWIMDFVPKLLLGAVCSAVCALSVIIVSRSDAYNAQLNQIVGFKSFILLAEKERLEKMLEDDPQFYYHILPYAQVLGVSDKWEEKFADITVEPPQWYASSVAGTVFRLHLFNSIMRNTMSTMTKNMVSRPSSGASGGHGGGHFGGFSGGGHGGGGGHFR